MKSDLDVVEREHVLEAMIEYLVHGDVWLYAETDAKPARNHWTEFKGARFPSKAIGIRAWQIATGRGHRTENWVNTAETTRRLRELGFAAGTE